METIVCKVCGKEVERKHNAQRYCDACRPKYYTKSKKPKKIKLCKEGISYINHLARESGMSYGQYVARMMK